MTDDDELATPCALPRSWRPRKQAVLDRARKSHLAAIGTVAVEWSGFEFLVDMNCIELAGIRAERGHCLTAQITGSARKLGAYIALTQVDGKSDPGITPRELPGPKLLKELHKFAIDTAGLAEQRNRIIHDPWAGRAGTVRLEATARKKLRMEAVPVPTKRVRELSRLISQHIDRFNKLHEAVKKQRGENGSGGYFGGP
jgi:hypothetical protein